jgi:hypothetical protein
MDKMSFGKLFSTKRRRAVMNLLIMPSVKMPNAVRLNVVAPQVLLRFAFSILNLAILGKRRLSAYLGPFKVRQLLQHFAWRHNFQQNDVQQNATSE